MRKDSFGRTISEGKKRVVEKSYFERAVAKIAERLINADQKTVSKLNNSIYEFLNEENLLVDKTNKIAFLQFFLLFAYKEAWDPSDLKILKFLELEHFKRNWLFEPLEEKLIIEKLWSAGENLELISSEVEKEKYFRKLSKLTNNIKENKYFHNVVSTVVSYSFFLETVLLVINESFQIENFLTVYKNLKKNKSHLLGKYSKKFFTEQKKERDWASLIKKFDKKRQIFQTLFQIRNLEEYRILQKTIKDFRELSLLFIGAKAYEEIFWVFVENSLLYKIKERNWEKISHFLSKGEKSWGYQRRLVENVIDIVAYSNNIRSKSKIENELSMHGMREVWGVSFKHTPNHYKMLLSNPLRKDKKAWKSEIWRSSFQFLSLYSYASSNEDLEWGEKISCLYDKFLIEKQRKTFDLNEEKNECFLRHQKSETLDNLILKSGILDIQKNGKYSGIKKDLLNCIQLKKRFRNIEWFRWDETIKGREWGVKKEWDEERWSRMKIGDNFSPITVKKIIFTTFFYEIIFHFVDEIFPQNHQNLIDFLNFYEQMGTFYRPENVDRDNLFLWKSPAGVGFDFEEDEDGRKISYLFDYCSDEKRFVESISGLNRKEKIIQIIFKIRYKVGFEAFSSMVCANRIFVKRLLTKNVYEKILERLKKTSVLSMLNKDSWKEILEHEEINEGKESWVSEHWNFT